MIEEKNRYSMNSIPLGAITLYWDETGPMVKYKEGILYISDLNPEIKMKWCMSKTNMLRLGWRCIIQGLKS